MYRHIIEFPGEMPSLAFSSGRGGGGGRILRQLSWLALLGSPYKTLSGLYFVPCGEAENPGGLFSGDRQGPSPRGSVGAVGPVWVGTPPPPRQTPYQALPPIVCVSSAEELPRSHYSRPRTKASESAGAPLAPYQPVAHTGYLGVGGGGCLAGDSQSAWTPHAKSLHGQDQPPLPRRGLGPGLPWCRLTLMKCQPQRMGTEGPVQEQGPSVGVGRGLGNCLLVIIAVDTGRPWGSWRLA